MKLIILILIIFSISITAQTDWERWSKKEISIAPDSTAKLNIDNSFISFFYKSYKFLISDLDGDNCAFEPSCSLFFVEAVKSTNILEGALLFADRFTRDLNVLKMKNYDFKNGKFYDPIDHYIFN
ncbi:MAG: membrane protein insertion efficiency factor YidD [Melioribacteraceae bacterium]|nr:membrane protein insertion efficiency factor YidD [Melioribacteraceae bacterium]